MYEKKGDISILNRLMLDISQRRVSRNRNFYTLAQPTEHRRFKRAKLLLSIVEDIKRTVTIPGYKVQTQQVHGAVELSLHDPSLHYHRQVLLSPGELGLIAKQSNVSLI